MRLLHRGELHHSLEAKMALDQCIQCARCEEVCPTDVPYAFLIKNFYRHFELSVPLSVESEEITRPCVSDKVDDILLNLMLTGTAESETLEKSESNELHGTVLLPGVVLKRYFREIVCSSVNLMKKCADNIIEINDFDDLGLPWLEFGLNNALDEKIAALNRFLRDNSKIHTIVCLDSILFRNITYNLRRWPCPMIGKTKIVSFYENPAVMDELLTDFESEDAIIIDRTVKMYDVLSKSLPKHHAVGDSLLGAGGLISNREPSNRFIVESRNKKVSWLASKGPKDLITLDPLTLLRFPNSKHPISMRHYGH